MNVNVWDVAERIRQLVVSGHRIPADRLADPAKPLGELASAGE